MSNRCPYCQSENFKPEAVEETDGEWINQCSECEKYSKYKESTGNQVMLDETRRVTG